MKLFLDQTPGKQGVRKVKLPEGMIKGETGQALSTVLVILLFGGLLVIPSLGFVSTNLIASRHAEEGTLVLYAADSGVEHGLWRVMYDPVVQTMKDDDPPIEYNLDERINNKLVAVSIDKRWLLEGLESPHQGTVPHSEWAVIGRVKAPGIYEVIITFTGEGNKKLERIGVWLPIPFAYVLGSSSGITTMNPNIETKHGGTVLTWNWDPGKGPQFKVPQGQTQVTKSQIFNFTPTDTVLQGDFAWIRFQSMDIFLSWDGEIMTFEVVSKAKNPATGEVLTEIKSNVIKKPDYVTIVTWEIK